MIHPHQKERRFVGWVIPGFGKDRKVVYQMQHCLMKYKAFWILNGRQLNAWELLGTLNL